ncbi:SRPBCC family protein [Streptomyces sp. 71268]|uniref:SRPBCC family protein n=1 Tax=Streptomyces sp. 71268 TaxID=3002640 RepID=UPI0023F66CBA|nr:SRPBCC family protein [Streptomyces sp. 71268]WEV24324.1 SRPBCC family protein [Streptomyces sp. 71268]
MPGTPSTRTRSALFALPLAVAGVLATVATPAGATPRAGAPQATSPRPAVPQSTATPSGESRPGAAVTCRGAGVDPKAVVRYQAETVIRAPLRTIWKLQTDVERWPSWQRPVETADRLDHGRFREGSAFHWTTPVRGVPSIPDTTLGITSTVEQLKRHSCIRWTGPAVGEGLRIDNGVHVWTFTEVRGGVLVRTAETHTGAQVEADVPTATALLGAGLEAWLSDLKVAAEARDGYRSR